MKIGSTLIGFALICVGIGALAGETPVLGVHPVVWFILGAGLMLSDSAWSRLVTRAHNHPADDAPDADASNPGSNSSSAADAPHLTEPDGDANAPGAKNELFPQDFCGCERSCPRPRPGK